MLSKREPCALCGKPAGFRCPGCDRRTCSLECYKEHKERFGCKGRASVESYVAIEEYNEDNYRRDRAYIERLTEYAEDLGREGEQCADEQAWRRRKSMLERAAKKAGVEVKFLPLHFTRHKQNRTQVKGTGIIWTVEVVDGETKTYMRVKDDTLMKELLPEGAAEATLDLDKGARAAVNLEKTLREALEGHTIIEFPTFRVKRDSE